VLGRAGGLPSGPILSVLSQTTIDLTDVRNKAYKKADKFKFMWTFLLEVNFNIKH
jgi:hypothetical protein